MPSCQATQIYLNHNNFNEFQWKSMKINENQWKSTKINENLRKSINIYENQRKSKKINENDGFPMEVPKHAYSMSAGQVPKHAYPRYRGLALWHAMPRYAFFDAFRWPCPPSPFKVYMVYLGRPYLGTTTVGGSSANGSHDWVAQAPRDPS